MKYIFLLFMLFATFIAASGKSYHVKTSGSATGNGSDGSPWNLQTALSQPAATVAGGDTIWIHGGTYRGAFISTLSGSEGKPVIVRAVAGEHVVIDGNGYSGDGILTFNGHHTWIWELTITSSDATRVDNKDAVHFLGTNNKLINCIVSNGGGNGVGFWKTAINSEVYGCIIYHNGTAGSDRGHGHGIYTQNSEGTKLIRNNIIFNSFGIGIQIYATAPPSISGYRIEGNTFFNCGLPYGTLERHIIAGGMQPVDDISVSNNRFYNSGGIESKAMMQFGYSSVANGNAGFTNNYMVDGSYYCISNWNRMTVTGNTIIATNASIPLIAFESTGKIDGYYGITQPDFDLNTYHKGNPARLTFAEWRNTTGQDAGSTYSAGIPAATRYFVEKNIYEAGRAHITVYNWEQSGGVDVDVSEVLNAGDRYELLDASNLAAGAVATGVFDGSSINVPMNLTATELPVGVTGGKLFAHTAPHFGAFVLRRIGATNAVTSSSAKHREVFPAQLAIYPNPAIEHVTVKFHSSADGSAVLTLTNMAGCTVIAEPHVLTAGWNSHTINLSAITPGIYIITVTEGRNRLSGKMQKL